MSQERKAKNSLGVEIGSSGGTRCPRLGANFGNINVGSNHLQESLRMI